MVSCLFHPAESLPAKTGQLFCVEVSQHMIQLGVPPNPSQKGMMFKTITFPCRQKGLLSSIHVGQGQARKCTFISLHLARPSLGAGQQHQPREPAKWMEPLPTRLSPPARGFCRSKRGALVSRVSPRKQPTACRTRQCYFNLNAVYI